MNTVFNKNIKILAIKNSKLALKLQNYIPDELPKLVQENGKYNFLYKDKYIHNRENPYGEAVEIFSMASNEPVAIHLIYGLGLGYLFQVVSQNSRGTVILYEPDLNILWTALTLVDFSNDFIKNNIKIVDNLEDASEEIYKQSGTTNRPQLLSLPSKREENTKEFDNIVSYLQNMIGSYSLDLKYTKEKIYPSLKMLIENIPALMNEIPLAKYKHSLAGKTGVIVSAGPSLDKNIEILKKYRDKFVLFTVGTAVKTLYKNGIKPDFLCIIETYDSSKQITGLDLKDVYFITEPYSNPALRKFDFKQILSHISANSPVNRFWAEIINENIEEYWSKGTVSYTALNSARLLGCNKIILVGQDLAYVEGQCYSKESAYKDLVCKYNDNSKKWEITAKDFDAFSNAISNSEDAEVRKQAAKTRLEALNNSLYFVKGINGDMIPTESVYAAFVKPLSDYSRHFTGVEYINTSLVGAQIDGFENISLEKALHNATVIGEIDLISDFQYNKDLIKTNLEQKIEELKEAEKFINEGINYINELTLKLNKTESVNKEILVLLKQISIIYMNLSGSFSEKSQLFDFITVADKIDLDYEMKMCRDFNKESVTRIKNKISDYLNNAQNKIDEISNLIRGVINENFNTES